MKNNSDLEKIISQGYSLDFGQTLDEIFDYFKKTFLLNGLVILIFTLSLGFIAFFGLGMGSLVSKFSDPAIVEEMFKDTTFLIYYYLTMIFLGLLLAPLGAGFIQLNRDIDTHSEVSISNIFTHYKSKHFLQIVGYTLILQIVSSAVSFIPIPYIGAAINILVSWFTIIGICLIIFSNLNALNAIKYSIKLVAKNPGTVLLVFIVSYLISLLGVFALCIGIFFTLPILYSMYYVLYKNIVGFEEEEIVFDIEKETEN